MPLYPITKNHNPLSNGLRDSTQCILSGAVISWRLQSSHTPFNSFPSVGSKFGTFPTHVDAHYKQYKTTICIFPPSNTNTDLAVRRYT